MLFSRDTSPESRRILIELLRKKTPAEKLEMVGDAFETARELTMTGLRLRHPDASASELEVLYLEHLLGQELARKVMAASRRREAGIPAPRRDAKHAAPRTRGRRSATSGLACENGLAIDRTSCSRLLASQLRALLTAAAFLLLQEICGRTVSTCFHATRLGTLPPT
jgi:hypothetical protein